MLTLPDPIRAWLTVTIERAWPDPVVLPDALPAGQVQRLASGGPFGLMYDARLDEIDGRIALEVLENSRMAGENYFRVWDDGTVERLEPAPRMGYVDGAQEEYFAHNRSAYDHLRERGFYG